MTNILILSGLAIGAGIVTIILILLDRPSRCETNEIDSAGLIRLMKEKEDLHGVTIPSNR